MMSGTTRLIAGPGRRPHAPILLVDDFLPAKLAAEMREDIDAHFAEPAAHRAEIHQVWNYWFVPELYTYLRTSPEKVIRRDRVDNFVGALQTWANLTLGMGDVTWPYLSLYVSGCRQGLHNDATNGRFAFVYSLTRDQRRTIGGETLVFHEGPPVPREPPAATGRTGGSLNAGPIKRAPATGRRRAHPRNRVAG